MYSFKEGDVVVIKKEEDKTNNGGLGFNSQMRDLFGKKMIIEKVIPKYFKNGGSIYRLKTGDRTINYWTDNMFERPIVDFEDYKKGEEYN